MFFGIPKKMRAAFQPNFQGTFLKFPLQPEVKTGGIFSAEDANFVKNEKNKECHTQNKNNKLASI